MKPKALYTVSDIFNLIGLMKTYEDLQYLKEFLTEERRKYKKEVFIIFEYMIEYKIEKFHI